MTATSPAATARGAIAAILTPLATAVALAGLTIALFFNPAWVAFEQARSHADAYTGWTLAQTQSVATAVVDEVWLGPGTFEQAVGGAPVFNERERSHMADVRRVVLGFAAAVVIALLVLLAGALATRRSARGRASWWRAVERGAVLTAGVAIVAGLGFALFFDQAFTLFHEIFFAAGTWTFDPATDRLIQLVPDPFWTETTVVIAIVGLGLTAATWAIARRRAASADAAAAAATSAEGRAASSAEPA